MALAQEMYKIVPHDPKAHYMPSMYQEQTHCRLFPLAEERTLNAMLPLLLPWANLFLDSIIIFY